MPGGARRFFAFSRGFRANSNIRAQHPRRGAGDSAIIRANSERTALRKANVNALAGDRGRRVPVLARWSAESIGGQVG
jgi:hypothetical protein